MKTLWCWRSLLVHQCVAGHIGFTPVRRDEALQFRRRSRSQIPDYCLLDADVCSMLSLERVGLGRKESYPLYVASPLGINISVGAVEVIHRGSENSAFRLFINRT